MKPEPYGEGQEGSTASSWIRSRPGIVFVVLGIGALYFLLTEHLAHTIEALPWIIVLLCPLMHVFMHGGHGGHGESGGRAGHADDSEGER